MQLTVFVAACSGADSDRSSPSPAPVDGGPEVTTFDVPAGSRPHDVAVAADGTVWYTAQGSGHLGRLDPATGATRQVAFGSGSAPHAFL